jgi:serine/threonine protein kinase
LQARQEAIDKKVGHLMIPKRDITELRTLGSGGYGTVVRGVWQEDTPVAVKKLNLGTLTERAKSDIKREAYMMSMVHSHPNVCKCYGLVLEEPNECALVMELYPSLLQLLHDDCTVLTWRNKLQLALDVAKGMAHLHTRQRPIVHGDLKPGNILVQVRWLMHAYRQQWRLSSGCMLCRPCLESTCVS